VDPAPNNFSIHGGKLTGLRALFMSHPPLEQLIAALEDQ